MRDKMNDDDFQDQEIPPPRQKEPEPAPAALPKQDEHWVRAYWRPAMGWLYMVICAMDFVVFPTIAMFMPVFYKLFASITLNYVAWQSITLSNGGLMHLAFGAILGVAAWSRGQEKIVNTR